MKIAYFVNQYPKVSHSFIRREIQALEKRGFQIERMALRGWDAELVDEEDKSEQQQTRYVLKGGVLGLVIAIARAAITTPRLLLRALSLSLKVSRKSDRGLSRHLASLAEACLILPWLRQSKVQHVHAHFGTNSAEIVMLAHVLGGFAYSFTVHGPEEFDSPRGLHLAEKVRHSKFVVAISSYGRSQLFRWLEHDQWNKVKVVHCGLESAFHDVHSVPAPSSPRLVCVGRLCEQKGQMLLIEAARLLKEKDILFELVLAGDGEMRDEVEKLIVKYDLADRIRITGWISSHEVREEIQAARGLVLPSFAEGLPVVIMEAMALKRPVLTTYVAGIPELVIHGESGLLFPAGSVEALASAMERFLACSSEEIQAMGNTAYERVLQRHDIGREVDKLAGYLKGMQ